jgi:uncharacterized membrane protein YfcA
MDSRHVLVAGAALVAGAVNAIAGGGSLLSFPALIAAGVPAVTASVTNTVALCPGYLGATLAQRRELTGQRRPMARILPFAALGGGGALLLLVTGEAAFDRVVPILLAFAAALLALQERLKRWLGTRRHAAHAELAAGALVGLAAVYGGYFGAGLGVIVLAALAVVLDEDLTRINALKQTVSLVVNLTAAAVFVASGRVAWDLAAVMAVAALAGGAIGGRVASRVPPGVLRAIVITAGLGLAIVYARRW